MKKIFILCLLLCLLMSCATTKNTEPQNDQSNRADQTIKVIQPLAPMAAPTENEQAMTAYNTGTKLLYENKAEEAEKYLKEAIELDPLFVDAMDHLGMVYRRLNRLAEAEEMYLKSIEINKDNLVPYQNLAIVYRLQGRLNEAFESYKTMITIDEDNPEPYYGIGGLLYLVDDYENSIMFFNKAIELYQTTNSPYVYDAFFYKGMIYYKINEFNEALKYLEEAQKGNPDNEMIKQIIGEIRNEIE